MAKIIPISSIPDDDLDGFNGLYDDVKGMSDHELELTIGSVRPPKLPFRSTHPVMRKFPQISNADYAKLHDDIRRNGQRKAICMYQGMIWDGRARYDACVDLGLVPKVWALRRGSPLIYLLERHRDRFGLPQTPERHAALALLRAIDTDEWRQEAKRLRAEWVAEARADFMRAWRSPQFCAVCGLSSEYSHAHHSLPLNLQYDLGVDEAIQEHDWVCPVHHKMIHSMISAQLLGTRWSSLPDFNYRYSTDDARRRAHHSTLALFAKVQRLFSEVGGVATPGNWAMLSP